MMNRVKLSFLLLAVVAPGTVHAQAFQPELGPTLPNPDASRSLEDYDRVFSRYSRGDTPTMRRQKLRWAIALRDEIAKLREDDGGTLTKHHRVYVDRQITKILYGIR